MNNPHVELNTVAYLIKEKPPQFLLQLTDELFENTDIKNIIKLIKIFYTNHGEFPGWDVLISSVVSMCKTREKSEFFGSLLDQTRNRDISGLDEQGLLSELQNFKKLRLLLESSGELVSAIQQKDAQLAVTLLKSAYDRVCVSSEYNLEDSDIASLAGDDIQYEFKKTGIYEIDKRSGISTGSLVLICGESGSGKSTLAHSMGVYNYLNNNEGVAYWSWEQGTKEITSRIWSYCSDVDLGSIISGTLTDEEKFKVRLSKAKFLCDSSDDFKEFCEATRSETESEFVKLLTDTYGRKSHNFFIFDNCPTFDELLIQMELLRQTRDVKMFVVDYLTLVNLGPRGAKMASWEQALTMSKELKTFARKNKVIVITPLQYDSGSQKIRFSSNIINDADLSLAMSENEDDKELGVVTCKFLKYRNFTSVKNEPVLKEFKLLKSFHTAKFLDFNF